MKKALLLIALVTLATTLLAALPAGAYHPKRLGNDIVCPKGSLQNAGGTTCTDKKTGEWVKPVRKHTIYPKQYPCPEMWKLKKDGTGCKKDKKAFRMIRRHS